MSSPIAVVALATRVAGSIVALGHLLGFVPGPLVAAVGGLALVTFGKALFLRVDEAMVTAGGLAVLGAAAGIGALRWGTLDLAVIRGAQAVLGPTVLVAPLQASVATWVAAAAGVLALGVWLAPPRLGGSLLGVSVALESALGALVLVSVFWGPAVVASLADAHLAAGIAAWAVAALAFALPALGVALLSSKLGNVGRTLLVATAALLALIAAELLVRAV